MADAYPEDTDVLLLRARIEAWKKNYAPAEAGFREVLRLIPGNGEALIGLAEVASWQGRYDEAIAVYDQFRQRNPADAEIYFRLGRVYLWQGNYDKARTNFERARSLDPRNEGYQRILKTAVPRVRDQYELRAEYQAESFSDGRKDYLDQRLAFQFRLSTIGPFTIKANATTRYDARDVQYGFEFYPHLWPRAYAYIDAAYSPKAFHFPRACYLAEIYQGIPSGWEFSLGCRRMNFSTQSVNVFLGSTARYIGRYIAFFRWYFTPNSAGETFSWLINLRRYFTDSSYIYAAYGHGSRPFDIVSLEDYSVTRSWVIFAGFDLYLFDNIKIQFNYTLRDEGELRRNLLYLGAGYRW
jgi:YaiO family outer membrane protein